MVGNDDDNDSDGDRPKPLLREGNSDRMGEESNDDDEALPPPPPESSPSPPIGGRPPRRASRSSPSTSLVSDISFDSPKSPRDSKVVADILEQVSTRAAVETPSRSRVMRQLTVADLKGASPMEAEAETLLLQTLEDKDSKPNPTDGILPNVPVEAIESFEGQPVDPSLVAADVSREEAFHEVADEVRASNTSTKRKLGGLTKAMRILQKKNSSAGVQDAPVADTGSFLNHADVLFRQEAVKPDGEATTSPSVETRDEEEGGSTPTSSNRNSQKKSPTRVAKRMIRDAKLGVTTELTTWHDFVEPNKSNAWKHAKWLICVLILPLLITAIILFYGLRNPMLRDSGASISWFCLFLLRNLITMSLAKFTEVVVIDYLSLRRRFAVKVFGPYFALLVVQSKGWPALCFWWGVWSLGMLCGFGRFQKHWMFYQDAITMCNATNPAGSITESTLWVSILASALLLGSAVSLKRLWLGLQLGKRSYKAYGEKLAVTIDKMLLVSEVATLSRRPPRETDEGPRSSLDLAMSFDSNGSTISQNQSHVGGTSGKQSSVRGSMFYDSLGNTNGQIIMQQLDQWEEPARLKNKETDASVGAVLQFRQSLSLIDNRYLFGIAFGPTTNRECCIQSGQSVYERLFARQGSGDVLHFDSIAKIAIGKGGTLNRPKLKALIRAFRPARDGTLTMIDFLKSTDSDYKDFRVLQASIENSAVIHKAFELMVNWIFYVILWVIILWIVGLDPFAMFLSISSFVLGFAFMIGNASSKYFEGLLFILVRRPYDIGDRISVSDPESDTNGNGSMTWFVEDLGLYSTTVRLAATNETATYSNGSLANSRIINANRSPQAVVCVLCKFGINVSETKIDLFKKATQKFVKERPREWIALLGFRATRCEPDLGFIEYVVVLQHREGWQNIGAILTSKADLTSFTLELSKQLRMRFDAPPLPVTLKMATQGGDNQTLSSELDHSNDLRAMFLQAGAGMSHTDDEG